MSVKHYSQTADVSKIDFIISKIFDYFESDIDKTIKSGIRTEQVYGNNGNYAWLYIPKIVSLYAVIRLYLNDFDDKYVADNLFCCGIDWYEILEIIGALPENKERRVNYDNIGREVSVYPENLPSEKEQFDIDELLNTEKRCQIYIC